MKNAVFLLLCWAVTASGQETDTSHNGVIVEFNPSVPTPEALWVMRSYDQTFTLHPERVLGVTLSSDNSSSLEKAREILLKKVETINSKQQSQLDFLETVSQPNLVEYKLNDTTHLNFDARKRLERSIPSTVHLDWKIDPAYAFADADTVDPSSFVGILLSEKYVRTAYIADTPNPSGYSVDSVGTVSMVDKESTVKVQFPTKPFETSVTASVLPSSDMVLEILQKLLPDKSTQISLDKAEIDNQGEYLVFTISHLRGSITVPAYWEKLRYKIPIYQAGGGIVKVRCSLEGEYATGLGDHEPAPQLYQSLEPAFTIQMQAQADRFITRLTTKMRESKEARR